MDGPIYLEDTEEKLNSDDEAEPAPQRSATVDAASPLKQQSGFVPDFQVTVEAAHGDLASPPRMLEPGVPMPVSADPTVPDPASVHDTPIDSSRNTSPQPAEEPPSPRAVLSAVPLSLLQQLSKPTSFSGLFTPFSEASSAPTSPPMQDSAEGSVTAPEETEQQGQEKANHMMLEEIAAPMPKAPQEPKSSQALPEDAAQTTEHDGEIHDTDLDADGDIDPDYVVEAQHGPDSPEEGPEEPTVRTRKAEDDVAEEFPEAPIKLPVVAADVDELPEDDAAKSSETEVAQLVLQSAACSEPEDNIEAAQLR